jgi:hypothetical protein
VSYRDALIGIADRSEAAVVALWDRLEAGEITGDGFIALAATAIATANRRAVTLADLSLAAAVSVQLRRAVVPVGTTPPDDLERLRTAAATVVGLGTVGRAARLARSEPLEAAARAYSEGIRRSPHVTGWTRQTSGSACPLCTGWAAAGVLPDTVQMATHKGCSCVPVPVTTEEVP